MTNKDSKANKVYKTNKNSKTFSKETTLIDSPSAEVNVYGDAFNNCVKFKKCTTNIKSYAKKRK